MRKSAVEREDPRTSSPGGPEGCWRRKHRIDFQPVHAGSRQPAAGRRSLVAVVVRTRSDLRTEAAGADILADYILTGHNPGRDSLDRQAAENRDSSTLRLINEVGLKETSDELTDLKVQAEGRRGELRMGCLEGARP